MTALLEISHLVVEMRRHHRWFRAVDEVSLSLNRGGSLGIVGESGCGKSVTLRAIMGLLPAAGRVHSGAVTVGGETLSLGSGRGGADRRQHRLAMIFQDALSALNPVMRVGDQIAEAPRRVLGLSRSAARERALDLLRVVGIPDPARRYDSYPHELSGGLRQRVMMAIALSSEPAILLCDEPTTALDVTIQAQILALLSDLRASSGLSIIFVTHDLGVVGQVCDDLAVMYAGRIVETGPVAEVLASPRHPYTDALLASALDVDAADSEPVAIPGAVPDPCGRCLAARSSPAARWLSQTAGWRRFRSGSSRPGAAPPACTTKGSRATLVPGGRMADPRLEVENLSVSFHAGSGRMLRAVDGVSFRLAAGEVLGLVGESGCGKTSVARCVAGLLTPAAGAIRLDGADLAARRTVEQCRAIQMVFQDPYSSLNPRMTVRHVLRELIRVHELVPASRIEDRCSELMGLVGLPAAALDGLPSQFSGGQRQRIAIARALAVEPRVLVADEPVSSLDVSVQATILRLFEDLRARLGLTVILISHNLAVVRHLSDQVAVMYLGRIVEQGGRDRLFASARHPYTQALLAAAPRLHQRQLIRVQVKGEPPSPVDLPQGCRFHPRCPMAAEICVLQDPLPRPVREGDDHVVSCHFGTDQETLSQLP